MRGLGFVAFVLQHPTFKGVVAGHELIGFADTELQVIVVAPCEKAPPSPHPLSGSTQYIMSLDRYGLNCILSGVQRHTTRGWKKC